MPAAITCACCNRPLRVPEGVLGRMVQCPLCLDEFIAKPDPAAEAAAREAEPPPRRAARPAPVPVMASVNRGPDPSPAVEIIEVQPIRAHPIPEEAEPPKKPARKAAERPPLAFPVLISRDPDRILRGRMDAELTADGLYLRKAKQPPAFAAVGGKARYLGANRVAVTVEGREIELAVVKPWTSTYHLAKDMAAFLNGKRAQPDARAYAVPWYLYALPFVPVGLPFVAIPLQLLVEGCGGAFLWIVITAALAGVCFAIAKQSWLTPRARVLGAGGVVSLGYLGLLAAFLGAVFAPPAFDPALWASYTPPGGDFRVMMPGTPLAMHQMGGNVNNGFGNVPLDVFTVDMPDKQITFKVVEATPLGKGPNLFATSSYQMIEDAKSRLRSSDMNGSLYQDSDRNLLAADRDPSLGASAQGREVVYRVSGSKVSGTLVARIFVVGDKVYTLSAQGPKFKATSPEVTTFFKSFRIVPAGAVPPPIPDKGKPPGPAPASPKDMPNGLLAYWSFDVQPPFGRTMLTDDSGKNCTGTLHAVDFIQDGVRGKGVHFSGQDSYFDFNDVPGLNFRAGDAFTFAGWVRTQSARGCVLSLRNDQDGSPVVDVLIEGGQLSGQVRQDGNEFGPEAKVTGAGVVNDGKWHHFAVTRNGLGTVTLFIDGSLHEQRTTGASGGAITTNVRSLGREQYWVKFNFLQDGAHMVGDLDEFCIYKRALTVDEVKKLAGK